MDDRVKSVDSQLKLPVYVFAGGKSRRFGSDKARALLKGIPLIVHVVEQLRPLASKIIVVADRRDKYQDLGLCTIADIVPGSGPLSGLHAALCHHASDDWILCVSTDRLGIKMAWLQFLLSMTSPRLDVVAFRDVLWQPLPAFYRGSLLSRVDGIIRGEKKPIWRLIEESRSYAAALPADWDFSLDVNDEQTLKRWSHG